MNVTSAIRALILLLQNCTVADAADFKQHAFYKTVKFVPEYPLATLAVPTVAFSMAGGSNRAKGLGHWERWREPRLQMDILAADSEQARRIYEKVNEVLLYDYNATAAGTEGTYGTRYLYGQGLKEVVVGEPNMTVWDEEGRVARIVADVRVTFTD